MKNKILFTILLLILISSFASATVTAPLIQYEMNDGSGTTATDEQGFSDGTTSSMTWITNYPTYNTTGDGSTHSGSFDGTDDYLNPNIDLCDYITDEFTMSYWLKTTQTADGSMFGGMYDGTNNIQLGYILTNTQYRIYFQNGGGVDSLVLTDSTVYNGNWNLLTFVKPSNDATTWKIYVNGVLKSPSLSNGATTYPLNCGYNPYIGCRNNGGSADSCADADYDSIMFWNGTITQSEIIELYNQGLSSTPIVPVPTLTTSIKDSDPEKENYATTLNLTLSWENYNITSSEAVLNYNNTYYSTSLISSDYSINGSAFYQSTIITPFIVDNQTLKSYYFKYNVTNFTTSQSFTSATYNQTLIFNYPRLNITRVYNAYSGMNLTNFTGNISKGSYNLNFNSVTGSEFIPLVNGSGNYSVYVEVPNYAISNETNYNIIELKNSSNLTTIETSFGLYSSNSVFTTVRNELDNALITANVTLTVTGNSSETVYTFTGGTKFISGLTDGEYNFKLESDGFTLRTYSVTVADNSFQNLAAYLTPSTNLVTLTFLDFDTSATLETVSITQSRLINSSWVVIESKNSDITGRAQFSYLTGILYRFYASKSEYTSKTFDLDPILFSEYNVRLEKITTAEDTIDYQKVSIDFAPKTFYNNAQNNFSIYFASPDGVLESYNYTVIFPTGSISGSGSNAVGENFAGDINISSAGFFDTVNITYTYDITIGTPRTYSFKYFIIGAEAINNTFLENKDETYGLGIFERVLIVTGVTLLISGTVALFLGTIPALSIALLFMGLFTAIGFYPLWLYLISALIGVIIIIKAGS